MTAFLSLYGNYNAQHLATCIWHYCKQQPGKKLLEKDRNTLIEQSDTKIEQS